MEENSFEKQVQDKMSELKIQPSAAAWENIEPRIAKKKSKKWGILFLLFCIILGGSYFYWNSMQHLISKEERVGKSTTNKTATNEKSSQEKKSITSSAKQNNNESNIISVNKKPDSISNTPANINEFISKQYIKTINKKRDLKTSVGLSQSPEQYFAKQKKTKKSFAGKASAEIASAISEQTQTIDSILNENDLLNQKYNADSLQQKVSENINKKINDTSKETKTVVKTVKNIGKNKWKIGAVVLPGISFAGNSFISSNSSYLNYPLAGNNQGLPGRTFVNSSTIKPGFAFIAGVFAEKNINKKSKFVIGFNYKSFATSNVFNDSILSSNKNKHLDHFNFIEIPLSIKIQINKGKYMPLIWQGGFSISQLISSNAFQFNSASGLYFTNDSFFNKTQIGFSTSLSAELLSKQKTSILIGPYFYYGASKIANEGLYNKSHFTFIGLRAEYIFGK